jgi:hypothetical protein
MYYLLYRREELPMSTVWEVILESTANEESYKQYTWR